VAALIRDGAANLGFVEGEVSDPRIVAAPVARDELVLVAAPDHAWSTSAQEPLDFTKVNWVLRETGSGTRDIVSTLLADRRLTINDVPVSLVLPSNEAVVAAVEAGAGVTIVSKKVVRNAILIGRLVEIECPVPSRSFFLLRHKEFHETMAVRSFIEMIDRRSHGEADRESECRRSARDEAPFA